MNITTMMELEECLQKILICAPDHDWTKEDIPNTQSGIVNSRNTSSNISASSEIRRCLYSQNYEKILLDFFESASIKGRNMELELVDSILADGSMDYHLEVIGVGIAALQIFVQINWTGKSNPQELENTNWIELPKSSLNELLVDAVNGEGLEGVPKHIEYLYLAVTCLIGKGRIQNAFQDSWSVKWWQLRCLSVHQQILVEKSDVLYKGSLKLIEQIEKRFDDFQKQQKCNDLNLPTQLHMIYFYIEVSYFYSNYYDVPNMTKYIRKATEISGIRIEETGVLGKRTKFQQRDLPQLTLNLLKEKSRDINTDAKEQDEIKQVTSYHECSLPVDVKLNDEVRLEKINFSNQHELPELSMEDQCLVFAFYILVKKSKPKDDLAHEQLLPYLQAILSGNASNQIWALRFSSLLERSKLERDNRRTIERSLMQIETLMDSIRLADDSNKKIYSGRMHLIYATKLPPYWHVEVELVRLHQAMGNVKSALDVAIRIELWEDVIVCYNQLNLKHKAAEIIKAQIQEKGESPLLLCMLGDASDDDSYYYKALKLSSNKCARAYKALGMRAYFKKEYHEAVGLLDQSLEINRFQPDILLRLGYASLEIENWNVAAKTYRLYCNYEPDNFEAWNNLANAYIKLNQKSRAFTVLLEAVKCDYDNWKIWDNILVTSVDCGHFEESIRAYHRILDIRESKCQNSFEGNTKIKELVDIEVLGSLVEAVTKGDILDTFGKSAQMHSTGLLKLFARISSSSPKHEVFYELYAKLIKSKNPPNVSTNKDVCSEKDENLYKAAQMMQKATAAFQTNNKGWEKSLDLCKKGILLFLAYGEFCLEAENCQQMASAKMTLKSVLTKVQKEQISMDSEDVVESLRSSCQQLGLLIDRILKKINELK